MSDTSMNSDTLAPISPADKTTDELHQENTATAIASADAITVEGTMVNDVVQTSEEKDTLQDNSAQTTQSEVPVEKNIAQVTDAQMPEPETAVEKDAISETTPAIAEPETPGEHAVVEPEPTQKLAGSKSSTDPIPTASLAPIGSRSPFRLHLPKNKLVSGALLLLLLVGVVTPLFVGIGYGIQGYAAYTLLRTRAYSGVQHLLNVKTLFTSARTPASGSSSSSGLLDTNKLLSAKKEFAAAHDDFEQMQSLIDHTALVHGVEHYLPQYRTQILSARAASQIGIDVSSIGQELVDTAITLAPRFRGPLLNNSQTPLITSADLDIMGKALDTLSPYVNDMELQTHSLSVDALPVSGHQREGIRQLIQLLPLVKTTMAQGHALLGAVGWLLGVNEPRIFLVQTMDRAELRPTGGFTGQYGELQIAGGRLAPFSLRDISLVEYADNSPTSDHLAPSMYRSWWPFANWGLRDSNLSADFPTSARLAINQYKQEVNRQVDGVILFTPFLIEQVLQVTGPIYIPGYNETITAQNLEERLHYYQLDNAGIDKQLHLSAGDKSTSDRKRFTSLVAHTLMDTVRHASPTTLLAIGRQMLYDMKTKDLQVYMTNPQLEDLLTRYGYAAQVDRSTNHDGVYVVQTNVSASKASQYVRTTLHDSVSLDASGGATHVMQLHLDYKQLGPVYGLDTYRDYVRVYVPPSAKLLWGDGFDTGTPLCGGPLGACPKDGIYPGGELTCPTGQYEAGAAAPMIGDDYAGRNHPLDKIGPPTNTTSDEPDRAMFGGYVVIPKNCSMTATLSWYVPPIGHGSYNLLVQRQAGTFPELDLTILPTPGACSPLQTQGMHFDSVLTQDASFPLVTVHLPNSPTSACYPQPGV